MYESHVSLSLNFQNVQNIAIKYDQILKVQMPVDKNNYIYKKNNNVLYISTDLGAYSKSVRYYNVFLSKYCNMYIYKWILYRLHHAQMYIL